MANAAAGARAAWPLVIALGLGVFVGGFDQTFVVPVLAAMLGDLGVAVDELERSSWILNGYLLGYTVALPLMGRLTDVYGARRVFTAGMLVFMGGSVLVALAPNLPLLAAARAVTAMGGGALVPVALSVAARRLPRSRRALGLGAISTLDDASSLAGPLWGTLIGVWLGWRGLFWMNLALALPVLAIVLVLLARAGDDAARARRERVDWPGALLLAGALTALTFALAGAGERLREPWAAAILLAGAAALLAAFVARQLRVAAPLVDVRMFRRPRVALANAVFLLEGMALVTAFVNVPLLADLVWGLEGAGPGLMLGRMVLFMAVGGLAGGALATLAGYRLVSLLGFALAAAGLFAMAAWADQPGPASLWIALGLAGLGFTLADASLYATVIEGVEEARRASAAAVLQLWQTLGMIVGVAILGSRGLGRFDERAASLFAADLFDITEAQLLTVVRQTMNETFVAAGALMVVAAALALGLGGGRLRGGG